MRGFTLTEVVLVLVIVGVLAAVAIPRFGNTAVSLPARAEQLASDIRYVQSRAMAQSVRHRLCLTASGYTFATSNCATPIAHPATGSTAPITFPGVTFGPFVNLGNNYIAFDSAGVPYSTDPGTALAATATITLTGQDGTAAVTIAPETGRVTP